MRPTRLWLSALAVLLPGSLALADVPPAYELQWGTPGTGNGQLDRPYAIAADTVGYVYVTDQYNERVEKFTSNGTYVTQWGSLGNGNGQFNNPLGVASDGASSVYVVDQFNGRVEKFTSAGAYVTQWGTVGSGNGQFSQPTGVATDPLGDVYVVDGGNNRVQKFTSTGAYLTQWGSTGSGNGQFNFPLGIAVDIAGSVYVADDGNRRVQKFTGAGVYITQWGSLGSGPGQFMEVYGVATDRSGAVYVTDDSGDRIQKFGSGGVFLTQWGSLGNGNGQFNLTRGIATDLSGNVFVCDYSNDRVEKFAPPLGTVTINFDTDPYGAPIANGAVVNDTYTVWGVTFEKVGPGTLCGTGPQVYASNDKPPAFGSSPNGVSVCPPPTSADFSQGSFGMVHALLAQPATSVSVDALPDGPTDFAVLEAYDAADNLIGSATSAAGATTTLAIATAGIRGVRFAGSGARFCRFDNVRITYLKRMIDFDHDPLGAAIASGSVVDNTYAAWGVTFANEGPHICGPDVYAKAFGTLGFGSVPNVVSVCQEPIASDFSETNFGVVHAMFDQPCSQVCIDVLPDSPSDFAVLRAYDATDHLLVETNSFAGVTQTLCVTSAGIRGVRFAGAGTHYAIFDNLRFEAASLVDVPRGTGSVAGVDLALSSPVPNPTRGGIAVWLTLPGGGSATLTLLDVAGRRVESRAVGQLGPGTHRVVFDSASRLPAGVYLIRLEQGETTRTTRAILLR
jgi:hypothetical protein